MKDSLTETLYRRKSSPLVKLDNTVKIKTKPNVAIFAFVLLISLYQLLIAPLLIKINFYFALTLIPCFCFAHSTWIVVHEAIHNMLHPNPRINRCLGRIMAVVMGISYDLQRIDHLRHHIYSRTIKNCDEIYNPHTTSHLRARINYFFNHSVGIYWYDFFLTLILCHLPKSLLYRAMSMMQRKTINKDTDCVLNSLIKNNKLRFVKQDGIALLVLLMLSIFLYKSYLGLFFCTYIIRAQILAVLDSFAHYDTPLNDIIFAKNCYLPAWMAKYIFMNFNYHGVHHLFPTVPWYLLPAYKNYFAPKFYLIDHGNLCDALKTKYQLPHALEYFPIEIVPNFRKSFVTDSVIPELSIFGRVI
jgi:fatty acid desaturase